MYCKSQIVVLHDLWQQTDSVDKLRLSFEDMQVCSLCINIIVTNKLTSNPARIKMPMSFLTLW